MFNNILYLNSNKIHINVDFIRHMYHIKKLII